jgi:hypothetical protein
MKLFLHTPAKIRIICDEQEFSCAPAAFAALEPAYPGLPAGKIYRYWTPDYSYLDGDATVAPDPLNCLPYIARVASYNQALPVIYAHVGLSKPALCANATPADSITVTAALKTTPDPQSPSLPVAEEWYIKLRHEDGLAFDSFRAAFVGGECTLAYIYREGIPLGLWQLREEDFALVSAGGQWYQVKLAAPVSFTIYREL